MMQDYSIRIQQAVERAEAIRQQLQETSCASDVLDVVFAELFTALEELRVSEEEFVTQNIALEAAHENALMERHRYQELFDFAPDGYLVTDLQGLILEANLASATMFDVERPRLLGKPLATLVVLDERHVFRNRLHDVLTSNRVQRWETRLQGKHRGVFDGAVTVAPALQSSTGVAQLRWLVQDITERKRMEREEREQFFRATFEQSAVGMAHIGAKGEWLRVNNKLCQLLGYTREALKALTTRDVTHPEDLNMSLNIHRTLITGEARDERVEKRFIRADGSVIWALVTLSVVTASSGQFLYSIAVIEDITERRRIEAAEREQVLALAVLAERQRLARDLHDAVSQTLFSANVLAESLPRLWKRIPRKVEEQLEQLQTLTRGALAEMRTLLLELRPEHLYNIDLVTQLRQLLDAVVSRKHIEARLEVRDGVALPPYVRVAFYRIAQEALNNVVKHSRASHVEVYYTVMPDVVTLRICDDGVGFDLSQVAFGFGLSNMRERADEASLSFQLDSALGKGTEIVVLWQPDFEEQES